MTIITLAFTNPQDPLDVKKEKISWDELFGNRSYAKEFLAFIDQLVMVKYANNLLRIETNSPVNVVININASPLVGVHVKTKGICIIKCAMNLELGLFVIAASVKLDAAIISPGFIALDTSDNPDGEIYIKKKITANKIGMITNKLQNESHVYANVALIFCKIFISEILSCLSVGNAVTFKKTLQDVNAFAIAEWGIISIEQKLQQFPQEIRYVFADSVIIKGTLKLCDVEFHITNNLTYAGNSKATYENVKIFSSGDMHVSEHAIIDGKNTFLKSDKYVNIEGNIKINNLSLVCGSLNVSGILSGVERLNLQVAGYTICNGIISADYTNLISNFILVTLIRNNINAIFGFFTKGGISGNKNLNINSLATVVASGGYLYSPNLIQRSGFFANLAGIIMGYNILDKYLYSLDLGITAPCSPNSFRELADPEKVFRLACRVMGSSFPMLRNAANLGSVVKVIGSGAVYAGSAVASVATNAYNDPQQIKTAFNDFKNSASVTATSVAQQVGAGSSYIGIAVTNLYNDPKKLETTAVAANDLKKAAFAKAKSAMLQVSEAWNQQKMIDWINFLLSMHDWYIYADMISAKGTSSLVFINDAKICMQAPSATLENIRNTLNAAVKNAVSAISHPELGANVAKAVNLELNKLLAVPTKAANKITAQVINAAIAGKNAIENPVKARRALVEHTVNAINTIDPSKTANNMKEHWVKKANDLSNIGSAIFAAGDQVASTQVPISEPVADLHVNPSDADAPIVPLEADAKKFVTPKRQPQIELLNPAAVQEDNSPLKTVCLDAAMIFFPSIDRRSIFSTNFGFTLSGSVMEENLLSSNNGVTIAIGTSTHTTFGYHNSGGTYSYYHNEVVGRRYNTGEVYANTMQLEADSNEEHGNFQVSKLIFDIKNNFHISERAKMNLPSSTYGVVHGDFIGDGDMLLPGGRITVDGKYLVARGAKHVIQGGASFVASDAAIYGDFTSRRAARTNFRNAIVHDSASYSNDHSSHIGDVLTFEAGAIIELINDLIDVEKLDDRGATVRVLNHITIAKKELQRSGNWKYDGFFHEQADVVNSSPGSTLEKGEDAKYSIQARKANLNGSEKHSHVMASIDEMPGDEAVAYALGIGKHVNKEVVQNIDLHTKVTENITYSGDGANGARVQIQTAGRVVLPPEFSRAQGLTFANYEEAEFFVRTIYDTYNHPPPPPIKRHGFKKYWHEISRVLGTASAACAHGGLNPVTMAASAALAGAAYGSDQMDKHYTRKESRELEKRDLEKIRLQQKLDNEALSMQEKSSLAQIENQEHIEAVSQAMHRLQNSVDPILRPSSENQLFLTEQKQGIAQQFAAKREVVNAQHQQQILDTSYQHARRRDDIARQGGPVIGLGAAVQAGATGISTSITFTAGNPNQTITGNLRLTNHEFSRPSIEEHYYSKEFPRIFPIIIEEEDVVMPGLLPEPKAIIRDANDFKEANTKIPQKKELNQISYADNLRISAEFIRDVEHKTKLQFNAEQKSAIREQIKISLSGGENSRFIVSLKNGQIEFGAQSIFVQMPLSMASMNIVSSNFVVFNPEYPQVRFPAIKPQSQILKTVNDISRFVGSIVKSGLNRSGLTGIGFAMLFRSNTLTSGEDNRPFIKEVIWVDVYNTPGYNTPIPSSTKNVYPALQPGEIDNSPLISPMQRRNKGDNIVSGYGSDPGYMDRSPLIAPMFDDELPINLLKGNMSDARRQAILLERTEHLLGEYIKYKEQIFERQDKLKTDSAVRGGLTELKGGQIPLAIERGCTYDHAMKVRNSQNGLLKHIEKINNHLAQNELPFEQRQLLEKELSETSLLLDYTEEFVPRISSRLASSLRPARSPSYNN